jgi:hypothetical protein
VQELLLPISIRNYDCLRAESPYRYLPTFRQARSAILFLFFTDAGSLEATDWGAGTLNPLVNTGSCVPTVTNVAFGGFLDNPGVTPGAAQGMIDPGKWFHVLYAVDCGIQCTADHDTGALIDGPLSALMINAVEQWGREFDPSLSLLTPDAAATTAYYTSIGASYPGTNLSYQVGALSQQLFPGGGYGSAGDFTYQDSAEPPNVFSQHFDDVDLTVPAFEIAIAGKTVALPGFFNANQRVQYGPVQIWVGQYIDIRASIDRFVLLSGGRGAPQPMSVANAAFGRPTFAFNGNKSVFPFNQGTGGAFTQIGTINDFSPGPTF